MKIHPVLKSQKSKEQVKLTIRLFALESDWTKEFNSWIVLRTQKAYSFPKGIRTLNTMFITNDDPFNPVSATFEKLILFERLIFDL